MDSKMSYLQIEVVKVKPKRNKDIVVSSVCGIFKQNTSQLLHRLFGHFYVSGVLNNVKESNHEGFVNDYVLLVITFPYLCIY